MMDGGTVIIYLLGMYVATMILLWHYAQKYTREPTPRKEIPLALFEGQTIIGVMDSTKGMRFCIGEDAMDQKEYE